MISGKSVRAFNKILNFLFYWKSDRKDLLK